MKLVWAFPDWLMYWCVIRAYSLFGKGPNNDTIKLLNHFGGGERIKR